MKLIIAGGRNYKLGPKEFSRLDAEFQGTRAGWVKQVISGGATGVDAGGEFWAKCWGIPVRVIKPNWKKWGRSAGPIRNKVMAKTASAVVLFYGGKGTESMFQEARKQGLIIYDWRNE